MFAIALALKDNNTLLLLLVTAVPASLLAAEILWRLVERHAIVLSLRVAGLAWPGGPSRAVVQPVMPSGTPAACT